MGKLVVTGSMWVDRDCFIITAVEGLMYGSSGFSLEVLVWVFLKGDSRVCALGSGTRQNRL
ncbi:hypothetical protein DPMN_189161 [Dreissena polymorpha]|uniref:Uncharacterized protein n=1 Tax=Dreissena polymorpha TaxID=45954 RepID=A0A9D4DTM0_DREPO|nr:hypothetical protein DPMN_189161 [Dreissena polymorpha]